MRREAKPPNTLIVPTNRAEANTPPRPVTLQSPRVRSWRWAFLVSIGTLVLLLVFSNRLATLYTDWLWFRSQGHGEVWEHLYGTRLLLFALFGGASFLLAFFNVRLADNFSPSALVGLPLAWGQAARSRVLWGISTSPSRLPLGRTLQLIAGLRPVLDRLLLAGALLFAVAAGFAAQAQWDSYFRFTHPVAWGRTDPLFHRDIGFYVFRLPWLRYVQGWLFTVFLLVGAGVTVVYLYQQGINWISEHHDQVHTRNQSPAQSAPHILSPIPPPVRAHLSALLCGVLLTKGFGYYLDRYDLLYGGGWLPGAGYTDIHVRLPMLHGALWVVGAATLAAFSNIWRRGIRLPLLALLLWLGYSGLGVVYPGWYQRIWVQPNEATWEAPYLERAITATRNGYGLDQVEVHFLPRNLDGVTPPFPKGDLWRDVPQWEPSALLSRFEQDVPLPSWEHIASVYFDRYPVEIDGTSQRRLIAIGVHEITRDGLEGTAQTWLSRHLRYTHGSGLTACLVGAVSEETPPGGPGTSSVTRTRFDDGGPQYFLPDRNAAQLRLTRPQVYFGSQTPDENYVLIRTRQAEVEAPDQASTNEIPTPTPSLSPESGLPLTPLVRAALTARFGTWSLLLNRDVTPETRLLLLRSVSEQVKRYAPFLLLDSVPYAVVYQGRIHWIVTGYTTSSAYPNAAVTQLGDALGPTVPVNYVRPTILADVDATDGQVRLFVADARLEKDPILRSYQQCFPDLIRPAAALPRVLYAHRRYPAGLLGLQQQLFTQYHTTDVQTFYSRAQAWEMPREAKSKKATEVQSDITRYEPSFLIGDTNESTPPPPHYGMALLERGAPEFVLQTSLLLPRGPYLSRAGRLAGVLVGGCDDAQWATLRWYEVPAAGEISLPYPSASAMASRFAQTFAGTGRVGTAISGLNAGPVRMVLDSGYLFYVQMVFAGTNESQDATNPPPRICRVRVSDGLHIVEAETLGEALKNLRPLQGKSR